ncbi:MAG: hypothetical protein LBE74_09305 [Treponema sp.]|nr:hypothetical protein [Treponema sp.]
MCQAAVDLGINENMLTGGYSRHGKLGLRSAALPRTRKTPGLREAGKPQESGLSARVRRKFIPTTNSNHGLEVSENILNCAFQADRVGEK